MFIDDVQRWLLGGPSTPETPETSDTPSGDVLEGFDLDGRWTTVWSALESIEDEPEWGARHHRWTAEGTLEAWLRAFLPPFERGIARRIGPEHRYEAIDLALVGEIHQKVLESDSWSRTVLAQLQRLAEGATVSLGPTPAVTRADLEAVAEWCWQNNLRSRHPGGRAEEITPLGRVLTQLHGRDAVEFALAVGVELSIGPRDPWRLGAAGLGAMLAGKQLFDTSGPSAPSAYHRDAISRLHEMGLAGHLGAYGSFYDRFELYPDAVELVGRVANEPDSRFRALVRALLDAERGRVSAEAAGRLAPDSGDLSYARSVAHEIRNLTLPLATALSSLWSELAEDRPDPERRQKLRERIDRSMDRLTEFAAEAVKLSAAIEPEELLLSAVVTEAMSATEGERNGRIEIQLDGLEERRVKGARRDWVSTFVNLFRNACQVRAGKGTVWVSTLIDDLGGLHIYVDDDGPGVPEELRERIFDYGHSTRGGSGVGLADARRTAEMAGGRLVCEEAAQGGARFHLSLPRRSTR